MIKEINIRSTGQGLHEITEVVAAVVAKADVGEGLCNIFLQHTSASLLIQENADPSARKDLERWMNRLVREDDPHFTHTAEGPDDMPSHIKASLTAVSLSVPIIGGALALGTWQGIYLWEHRKAAHQRKIIVSILRSE